MTSGTFTKILKERQRQQRRRKLIAAGVVAVVVALVGFAIYAFYFSSWLVVKAVEVSGHELLTEGEVLQAAAVELERPLISADVTSIAARVSALKPVADVKVSRSYPDRVVIEITEREALYQLATDTSFEWVDETGTIFHSTPEATEDLIRVRITRMNASGCCEMWPPSCIGFPST